MLLGVDVGTTGTKAVLMREDGTQIHSSYQGYELISSKPAHVEQRPEDWWQAIVCTVTECVAHLPAKEEVSAMSLSVQSGTLVPVDENFEPVTNAISWLDTRCSEEKELLTQQKGEAYFYRKTGWRLTNCYNFVQICHMRRHHPQTFQKTAYFLSVADYLVWRLTGELVIDENSAENSQLCNVQTGHWDEEILSLAGIDKTKVPPMIKSAQVVGRLTKRAAEQLRLSVNTLVVSGAQDQYCSAVSIGAFRPGDIMFSTGTSWVLVGISDKQLYDMKNYLTIGRHMVPGLYSSFAYTPAGGAALKWYRDTMWAAGCEAQSNYDAITERAGRVAPGAQGLVFLPHLGGALFPTWSVQSKGVLWGLDFVHTKAHIARAVLEGISFELLWMMQEMKHVGYEFKTMKCLGGSTRSLVWMQIVADMTGLDMQVSRCADMAPRGAAMAAGVGSGVYRDFEEAYEVSQCPVTHITPNWENYRQYQSLFDNYKNIFFHQRSLFEEQEN